MVWSVAFSFSIVVLLISELSNIFFSLHWQGLKAVTKKQKYDKICEKKLATPIEVCIRLIMFCTRNKKVLPYVKFKLGK